MKLTFYGGAKEVSGSNYLLEVGDKKILIDCGFIQGERDAEQKNFAPFPYDPKTIAAVLVTHAHVDHTGRLPFLYQQGFRGTIFSTPPTKDLALLLMDDSVDILARNNQIEEQVVRDLLDIVKNEGKLAACMKTYGYDAPFLLGDDIEIRFLNAGHILGSSFVQIRAQGKTILFSGDIGNMPSLLLDDPAIIEEADYVIMESVYGDRIREKDRPRRDLLEDTIEDTASRGGVLMIPSFALERTQEILYDMDRLVVEGRIPHIPVFVDSPLAIDITKVFGKHSTFYRKEIKEMLDAKENIFSFQGLLLTPTVQESKRINDVKAPKVIIAGSGMSEGGRILHHERRYLSDEKNTLLFVGYQARGTRGRRIQDGATSVTIFDDHIPVHTHKVFLEEYSAHADQEQLIKWAKHFKDSVKKVFIVQGEEQASNALAYRLQDLLGIDTSVPSYGESVELE